MSNSAAPQPLVGTNTKRELSSLAPGQRFKAGSSTGIVIRHRGAVVEVRVGTHDPAWWLASTVVEPLGAEVAC